MKAKLKALKESLALRPNNPGRVTVETGRNALGLKELVGGTDPIIDIVAVHGLNGHRETTWTDEKSRTLWLRDLLPHRFPNARILTFGYDADTLKLSEVSHLSLNDHGTSLIVELLRFRRNPETKRRPIIFLAHSLGGIVIKHALVTCDSARQGYNEEYRSIKLSTYGVVFFGTPHAGANGAEFQAVLNNIVRIFVPGNSKILQLLKRDSDYLRYLTELYSPISSHFKTVFFWEEFNTPLVKGASIMIVPRTSAVVSGATNSVAIALHKHHIDLVKYSSEHDGAFETVSDQISVMMKSGFLEVTDSWLLEMKMKKIGDKKSAELQQLSDIVHGAGKDQRKVAVLHGLGGIGKTDIALEHAWQSHAAYTSILWIHATTAEVLKHSLISVAQHLIDHLVANQSPVQQDFIEIAHDLGIAGLINGSGLLVYDVESDNQERIVGALSKWLAMEGNDQWLLVFDNVDDIKVIDRVKHFPQSSSGTIIITSRRRGIVHWSTGSFQVEEMNQDDALVLFMTRAQLNQKQLSAADCTEAETIIKELGYLPLAIEQAGAYIWAQGSALDQYLIKYKTNFQSVTESRPEGLEGYATVYTTWQISLQAIKAKKYGGS